MQLTGKLKGVTLNNRYRPFNRELKTILLQRFIN